MTTEDRLSTTRSGLVEEFTGAVTTRLAARPRDVWGAVTDLAGLAAWNDAIESVAEVPRDLEPGAQWVVVMHPRGWPRWRSRSTVEELDPDALRFVHTTRTDDDNPSWATWTWQARPHGNGTELSVTWRVHPRTLGRRSVLARLRRRMLQREVARSLDRLDARATEAPSAAASTASPSLGSGASAAGAPSAPPPHATAISARATDDEGRRGRRGNAGAAEVPTPSRSGSAPGTPRSGVGAWFSPGCGCRRQGTHRRP